MELANKSSHYKILKVKEDASQEEIRSSYKSALLLSHPDKHTLHKTPDTTTTFLQIQTAWQVLGNANSRALYDMELRLSRQDDFAADDEVLLEDLMLEASGDAPELVYHCRCGDHLALSSSDLEEMGFRLLVQGDNNISLQPHNRNTPPASILLPCASCSLKIRLIINGPIP